MGHEHKIICGTLTGVLMGLAFYHFFGKRSCRYALKNKFLDLKDRLEDRLDEVQQCIQESRDRFEANRNTK